MLAKTCGNGNRRALALKVKEGLLTGCITFEEALNPETGEHGIRTLKLDGDQWLALVKFLFAQVDGPPKGEVDLTTGGEPLFAQLAEAMKQAASVIDEPDDE